MPPRSLMVCVGILKGSKVTLLLPYASRKHQRDLQMEIHSKIEQRHFDNPGKNHLVGLAAGEVNYWTSFISDPLTVGFFLFWEAAILRSSIISLSVGYG